MAKVCVVTPTYNEKENLRTLVERIFSQHIQGLSLLVVDDNSPDKTADLAEALSKNYPITVIRRAQKKGLGTAYVSAFKKLLSLPNKEKPDFIIQMDADLSHDPSAIPDFLTLIKSTDLVLGSRYVEGGAIVNWELTRRLVSKWGNVYARTILQLPYRDLTGGYKCWRRTVLEKIDLDSLSSVGYNFQIETTYRAHQAGYAITEIPISFTERKHGKSKMDIKIMLESFWKVLLLRFSK